jgi:DNA-binding MarR family transcriptional regulator
MTQLILDTYLPYRLSMASNKVSALIAKAYETRFGLSIPQWRILVILSEGGAISQKGLIERTAMDKVTISRSVGALVGRGLLLKVNRPGDRRIDALSLSEEGLRIVSEVAPVALEFETALIASIGLNHAGELDRMLRKLEKCAETL